MRLSDTSSLWFLSGQHQWRGPSAMRLCICCIRSFPFSCTQKSYVVYRVKSPRTMRTTRPLRPFSLYKILIWTLRLLAWSARLRWSKFSLLPAWACSLVFFKILLFVFKVRHVVTDLQGSRFQSRRDLSLLNIATVASTDQGRRVSKQYCFIAYSTCENIWLGWYREVHSHLLHGLTSRRRQLPPRQMATVVRAWVRASTWSMSF